MKKRFHMTKKGVSDIEAELKELIAERGPVAERIKTAREFGDLSENAEYSSARLEQEKLETRIAEIETIMQSVAIIKKPRGDTKVQLGSFVKLKNNRTTKEFTVVGTVEADPLNGKISNESPIGEALIGKKLGEKVEIKTNSEPSTYTIIQIG